MLLDFAVIFIVAFAFYWLFEHLRLPGILGMLLGGVILGPQVVGLIDAEAMEYAGELRLAALIVILIRAGLGIDRNTLNQVGLPAALLGVVPCLVEGAAVFLLARELYDFSVPEAGMLAFILAAVSPAVIVPQMIELREAGYGRERHVPTLVLAAASLDDVVAITLFGVFAGLVSGNAAVASQLFNIPLSIGIGLAAGLAAGWLLLKLFERVPMGSARMALLFMVAAILLTELEHREILPIASLLGVMAMGFIILERNKKIAGELSGVFANIWVAAEVVLFVALGATVDFEAAAAPGTLLMGLVLIGGGLVARSVSVWLSLGMSSDLTRNERLFCALAFTPKATVQAAIGAIPLAMGVPAGAAILSIAVLSIIITAPMGALLIRTLGPKLLERAPLNT